MAKNYVYSGNVITWTAPYAVSSGGGALITNKFVVALADVANGARGEWATEGVWVITALSTDTAAEGAKLYWDNTNKRLTTTASGNTLVGVAHKAKVNGDATVEVLLGIVA